LRNHSINVELLLGVGLCSQLFQSSPIFDLEGFLARFVDHPALDPHLDAFGGRQRGAFVDEGRCDFGIPSTQDVVEKGL
jgi:hypothetical protein